MNSFRAKNQRLLVELMYSIIAFQACVERHFKITIGCHFMVQLVCLDAAPHCFTTAYRCAHVHENRYSYSCYYCTILITCAIPSLLMLVTSLHPSFYTNTCYSRHQLERVLKYQQLSLKLSLLKLDLQRRLPQECSGTL
jgi:hypothetical protein